MKYTLSCCQISDIVSSLENSVTIDNKQVINLCIIVKIMLNRTDYL